MINSSDNQNCWCCIFFFYYHHIVLIYIKKNHKSYFHNKLSHHFNPLHMSVCESVLYENKDFEIVYCLTTFIFTLNFMDYNFNLIHCLLIFLIVCTCIQFICNFLVSVNLTRRKLVFQHI